jgi:hypothetical protein
VFFVSLAICRLTLELVVTAALKLFGVVGETATATPEAVVDSVGESLWVVAATVDFAYLTLSDDTVLGWVPRVVTIEAKMVEAWVEGLHKNSQKNM